MQQSSKTAALAEEMRDLHQQEVKFQLMHSAIVVLRDEGSHLSHFLAKRLGQGHAAAKWSIVNPDCMRIVITYRGQTWSLRVPRPAETGSL